MVIHGTESITSDPAIRTKLGHALEIASKLRTKAARTVGQMDALEATYTLAFAFPLMGAAPGVLYAAVTYWAAEQGRVHFRPPYEEEFLFSEVRTLRHAYMGLGLGRLLGRTRLCM